MTQSSQSPSQHQSTTPFLPTRENSEHDATSHHNSFPPSQSKAGSFFSPTQLPSKEWEFDISIPPFPPSPGPTTTVKASSLLNTVTFFVTAGNFSNQKQNFYRTLANLKADFLVHLGDFNDYENTHCLEYAYRDYRNIIVRQSKLDMPSFFTLGDNEWADCYSPTTAKEIWEEYFTLSLDRKWSMVDKHNFSDFSTITTTGLEIQRDPTQLGNFAFLKDRVLFIGLNMVRGRTIGGDDEIEWMMRLEQNQKWIHSQLDRVTAVNAIVLFGQKYYPLDNAARDFFEQLSLHFTVPALYVYHSHEFFGWNVKKRVVSNKRIWFLGVEDSTLPFMKVVVNATALSVDDGTFFFTQDNPNNFVLSEDHTITPTDSPVTVASVFPDSEGGYLTKFYVTSGFFLDEEVTGNNSQGYREAIANISFNEDKESEPFFVHLGNIIDPDVINCEEYFYKEYSETLVANSNVPVYVLVGDRDWEGCIDKLEAEQFWKAHLLDLNKSINDGSDEVAGSSPLSQIYSVNRPKDQLENFSFFYNDVIVVGLHITRSSGDAKGVRLDNNFRWTVSQLRKAIRVSKGSMKALVMFGYDSFDGNEDFFEELSLHIEHYGIPAVYIHTSGDYQSRCEIDGIVTNNAIWFCSVAENTLPFLRVEINTTTTTNNDPQSPFFFIR